MHSFTNLALCIHRVLVVNLCKVLAPDLETKCQCQVLEIITFASCHGGCDKAAGSFFQGMK